MGFAGPTSAAARKPFAPKPQYISASERAKQEAAKKTALTTAFATSAASTGLSHQGYGLFRNGGTNVVASGATTNSSSAFGMGPKTQGTDFEMSSMREQLAKL